jgi:hypothetical protein
MTGTDDETAQAQLMAYAALLQLSDVLRSKLTQSLT